MTVAPKASIQMTVSQSTIALQRQTMRPWRHSHRPRVHLHLSACAVTPMLLCAHASRCSSAPHAASSPLCAVRALYVAASVDARSTAPSSECPLRHTGVAAHRTQGHLAARLTHSSQREGGARARSWVEAQAPTVTLLARRSATMFASRFFVSADWSPPRHHWPTAPVARFSRSEHRA